MIRSPHRVTFSQDISTLATAKGGRQGPRDTRHCPWHALGPSRIDSGRREAPRGCPAAAEVKEYFFGENL